MNIVLKVSIRNHQWESNPDLLMLPQSHATVIQRPKDHANEFNHNLPGYSGPHKHMQMHTTEMVTLELMTTLLQGQNITH